MKIQFLIVITFSLISLWSCDNLGKEKKISEDKLVDVLVDIHLADGTLTAKGYKVKQDSLIIHKYYDYVFVKHETTPKSFKTTLDYYTKHPDQLDLIYVKVLERLTILEGQLEEERTNAAKIEE